MVLAWLALLALDLNVDVALDELGLLFLEVDADLLDLGLVVDLLDLDLDVLAAKVIY